MKPILRFLLFAALPLLAIPAMAQLAVWDFNGANYLTASSYSPNLSMAPMITYGAGVTNNGQQNVGSCDGTLTSETSDYGALIDPLDYLEFTLTPDATVGTSITIDNIIINARVVGTGPVSYQLRSSQDAYLLPLASGTDVISKNSCTDNNMNVGITTTDPITFRIYFYMAGNGTARLNINNLIVNGTEQTLPVRVINFSAARNGYSNRITWDVAEELNLMHYTVERSTDARNYVSLGKVSATNSRSYSFVDSKPAGVNYYRLVVTERNGAASRGKVVSVVNESNGLAMQLQPSLVSSNANLVVSLDRPGVVNIFVTDMSGRAVLRSRNAVQGSGATIPMNFSNLKAGTYTLQLETESGKRENIRFVKQ